MLKSVQRLFMATFLHMRANGTMCVCVFASLNLCQRQLQTTALVPCTGASTRGPRPQLPPTCLSFYQLHISPHCCCTFSCCGPCCCMSRWHFCAPDISLSFF